jgi:hypothetical protein
MKRFLIVIALLVATPVFANNRAAIQSASGRIYHICLETYAQRGFPDGQQKAVQICKCAKDMFIQTSLDSPRGGHYASMILSGDKEVAVVMAQQVHDSCVRAFEELLKEKIAQSEEPKISKVERLQWAMEDLWDELKKSGQLPFVIGTIAFLIFVFYLICKKEK